MRREHAGQRDGEDDAGPVGQHAGRRQRPGLQQPGPQRLDAGSRLGVEDELGTEIRPHRVGGERHRGRHALDDELGRRRVRAPPARSRASLGRRCLVLHADSVDQRQDLPLQQLPAGGAHVDAVGRPHVDPVECRACRRRRG